MLTERHGARRTARSCGGMGRDGWLGVGWPAEYGGRGLGQVEQQIFVNEAARADVPLPAVTLQTVGPTLQAYGTPEQKDLLPAEDPGRRAALRDRVHRAGGRHRPGVAADPGGPRRRRVRGERPEDLHHRRPRRRLRLAGLPYRPGRAPAQGHLDPDRRHHRPRVLVDADHHLRRRAPRQRHLLRRRAGTGRRCGSAAENGGWRLVTTQLNHERVMLGPAGRLAALHDRVRDWARPSPAGRAPLLDQPDVRRALARTYASAAGQRAAELAGRGGVHGRTSRTPRRPRSSPPSGCSSSARRWTRWWHGTATRPTRRPRDLVRWLDVQAKRNLVLTFGGGVNEVQRELIATAGLGLPRVPADDHEGTAADALPDDRPAGLGAHVAARRPRRIAAAGQSPPRPARDPVNLPMIRNWVEAIGDANPVYTDPAAAAAPRTAGWWRRRRWSRSGRCAGCTRTGADRRPAVADVRAARRGRVHLGRGHEQRPGLPPVPAAGRAGRGAPAGWSGGRAEADRARRGLVRDHAQHLVRRRRAGGRR